MIVSLGVAPNAKGKISQNTGALSRPDGLAVANVLLSRARLRTVVYSSVLPWEIDLAAMTSGMFLIASMLRMATVVSAPAVADDQPIHEHFLSDQWTTHQLEVEGESVYGLIHRDFPDRYALAVCFSNGTPVPRRLRECGWKVIPSIERSGVWGDRFCRQNIDVAMKQFAKWDGEWPEFLLR